jgi:transcriptional regulator with XRE-family HTH domain
MAFVRAVGAEVRARRLRAKLTRAELARRSGLSAGEIAVVEAGDPDLDLLRLAAVAAGLRITLHALLRRAERRAGWRSKPRW